MTNLSEKLKRIFGTIAYGTGVMLGNICDKKSVFDVVNDLAKGINSRFLTSVDKSDFKSLNRWLEDHKFDKSFADKLQALIDTPSLNSVVVDIIVTNINSTKTSAANGTPRSRLDYKAQDVATLSRVWLCLYDQKYIENACKRSEKFNGLDKENKARILEILEISCSAYLEDAYDKLDKDYKVIASVIIRTLGSQITDLADAVKNFVDRHPINADEVTFKKATVTEILYEAYTLKCPFCGNVYADTLSSLGENKVRCHNCETIFFCAPASSWGKEELERFIAYLSDGIFTDLRVLVTQLDHKLNIILQQTIAEGATTRSHITDEAVKTRSHMSTVGEKIEEKIDDTNAQMNAGFNSIKEMLQQLKDAKHPSANQTTSACVREDFPKGSAYHASFQKVQPSAHVSTNSRRRPLLTTEIRSRDAIIENGVLKKYNGSATDVVIPASVTRIDDAAFWGCASLSSITIPSSVTSIGDWAFDGCTSLSSITIPDSVKSIGDGAFDGCTSLSSITVHENNKVYRSEGNCLIKRKTNKIIVGCKNSIIPNSVKSIGDGAFSKCTGLNSITIPNSVTSIKDFAFAGCSALSSIRIPDSVTHIGNATFKGCTSLASITVHENNNVYRTEGNCLIERATSKLIAGCKNSTIPLFVKSIGLWAFSGCISLTSIILPDSVTSIDMGSFENCSSLSSITIPNSVKNIGRRAFYGCSSLSKIYYRGSQAQWLKISKGENWDNATGAYDIVYSYTANSTSKSKSSDSKIPSPKAGVTPMSATPTRKQTLPSNDAFARDAIIENGVLKNYNGSATDVVIPASVTRIDEFAFWGCASLSSITIPSSVTSIGDWAFDGCTSLSSITIPDSVKSIGDGAFWGCTSLFSITIPDSVTSIGDKAFHDCSSLSSITIPDSVTRIGDAAFWDCSSLSSITIPDSVTSIGDWAFCDCSSLSSITIPGSVKNIGAAAFWGCTSLRTIRYGGTKMQWILARKGSLRNRLQNNDIENCQIIFNAKLSENGT